MKICNQCGTPNEDSQVLCSACGGILPDNGGKKNRKSGKGGVSLKSGAVKWIAGALAAVMVAGGGILYTTSDQRQVVSALAQNQEAITQEISRLPQLTACLDHAAQLHDDGELTISADILTEELALAGTMDYDRGGKALAGSLTYANTAQDLDVKFDFASDNKEFTLSSDRISADIYGFRLKEFAEMYSKTPLALLFPLTDSNDQPNVNFFRKVDFAESMENKYGEAWSNFKKSLGFEELNERQMDIGGRMVSCRAYEITWDTAAASKLVSAVLGQEDGFLDDLIEMFAIMEPDCRLYVDENDYVVAADFVAVGSKCTVKFEGTENVWEKCTLSSLSIAGGEGDLSGEMTIRDGVIAAKLNWDGVGDYSLDYDDNTGAFSVCADTGENEWFLDGSVTAVGGGAQFHMGGYLPTHGRVDVHLNLNPLAKEPELMSDKYVDLMDMDAGNWQRLLIDINNSN